jgi:hypothetical protein
MARAINEQKDYSTGQVTTIEVPWTQDELKEHIGNWRWARETSGIIVGLQPVSTFRDEMPVWQGMLLDMERRPGETTAFEYKPRGGENVTLTPAQVSRVYECFAWYVAACFATERHLIGMIEQGADLSTVAAAAQNLETWPQTSFEWTAPS